jgi:nucleotide-binding universal stress UspA family protein
MKRILVPIDFSAASESAIQTSVILAKRGGYGITLLHIKNSHTKELLSDAGQSEDQLQSFIAQKSEQVQFQHEIECKSKIIEGSIFDDINAEAENPDYFLIVIGSRGSRGIRQALFGADLLKIAKSSPVPVLAVPEGGMIENVENKIVFPYGGHVNFEKKTRATALIADVLDAEVKLYSVNKGINTISQQAKENAFSALEYFKDQGIKAELVEETMEGFSIGFASQTLDYAKEIGAGIISVMSTSSKELSVISASDKEALINNQDGISILLTSDY